MEWVSVSNGLFETLCGAREVGVVEHVFGYRRESNVSVIIAFGTPIIPPSNCQDRREVPYEAFNPERSRLAVHRLYSSPPFPYR